MINFLFGEISWSLVLWLAFLVPIITFILIVSYILWDNHKAIRLKKTWSSDGYELGGRRV